MFLMLNVERRVIIIRERSFTSLLLARKLRYPRPEDFEAAPSKLLLHLAAKFFRLSRQRRVRGPPRGCEAARPLEFERRSSFSFSPPLSRSLSLSVARSVSTIKVYISAQGPAIHLPDISRRDARLRAAEHSEEKEYCRSSFAVLQVPVVVGRVDLRRRFCGRAAAPAL